MKKVIIIFLILILCGCKYINSVDNLYILNYLNTSYGDKITFTFKEDSTCELYQMGFCSAYYTANDINDDVYVIWYDGDGLDIRDDYLFKKYKNEIKDYYNNMFAKIIGSKYDVEILSQKSDLNWAKDAKYEDILNYEDLNLSIRVNIASDDFDTTGLGEKLKNQINTRKVKNVSSLYITTFNSGCNLKDTNKCKKVNSSYTEVKITEEKREIKQEQKQETKEEQKQQ